MAAVDEPQAVDPVERARRANAFFGPLVPGQLGCVFDHSAADLVTGHIDVTENLIAGTGFLFAPASSRWRTPAPRSAAATTSRPARRSRRSS
jgi:hypothetical protein